MRFAFNRAERASADRMGTVSYGEERPIALDYTEDVLGNIGDRDYTY